ncbi:MAG TPA: HD domain-containing protein [Dehalococcoidia bacterium]|nr:HD domain-containing protein [Dehalococcoidia bacterium]
MAPAALTMTDSTRGLLAELDRFFAGRGLQAYVVGGFVRDALLGRDCHDIDVAFAGDPLEVGKHLADAFGGHYIALAEEQHVARVLLPERGVQVDLMPMRAEIEADLAERDFTIDAMAVPLAQAAAARAQVIDPTGGLKDLRGRVVRVVREDAFRHDALRPLRGVRLAIELEFAIDPATAELIRGYAQRLPEVSVERQRDELMRIMATARAGEGLRLLDDLGLLAQLLPEMDQTRGVEQPKEHYWDVFGHSLEAVRNLDILLGEDEPRGGNWRTLWRELWGQLAWWTEARAYFREPLLPERPRTAVLKLAGLLHDIAKPETKTFDDTGRMRFFGHADAGARACGRILRRLRFSAREVALVQTMVKAHLRPVQMGQQGPPTRRALYRYFRDCGEAAIATLFLSLADHLGTVGPRVSRSGWRQPVALVNYILTKRFQDEETISPPKLLGGDELMAELKLSPGPAIGRLIETLREAQAAGEISTREEALALARTCLAGEPSGSPAGGEGG